MNQLLKLALMAMRVGTAARRPWKTALLCMVLAVPCLAGAVGCGVAALWIWLIPHVGPVGAPLIVAGALLLLAVILLLLGLFLMKRRRTVSPEAEALTAQIGTFLQEHKGAALLLTLAAGLVAGGGRRK